MLKKKHYKRKKRKSTWVQSKCVCHNKSENSFIRLSLVKVSYSCLNKLRQSHIPTKPVQFPPTVWWQPRLWSDNCHFVCCNQKWLRVKWHVVHFLLFDHMIWHIPVPLQQQNNRMQLRRGLCQCLTVRRIMLGGFIGYSGGSTILPW